MIYAILISVLVFFLYLIRVITLFGVPASLSDTYYLLKEQGRPEFAFTLAMWGMSIPLMPVFLDLSPIDYTQFLGWLPCAALCFVGAAPEFKKGLDRTVHITATVICALGSQAWVAIYHPYFLFIWSVPIFGIGFKMIENIRKNKHDKMYSSHPIYWTRPLLYRTNALFWVEMTAFVITYLALALSCFS